jgi:hypothetical protein
MDLSISGRVTDILQEQSGQGKNGTWRKRDFVVETQETYPKKVCMTQWGDEIDKSALSVGDMVKASIDISSREYNGRWYTDIKAWRVDKNAGGADSDEAPAGFGGSATQQSAGTTTGKKAEFADPAFDDDDLPF